MLRKWIVICTALILAGCASSGKKMQVKGYIEDRPRLDQSADGNQGMLVGNKIVYDQSVKKKTRKVFVVELSKEANEGDQVSNVTNTDAQPAPVATSAPIETETASFQDRNPNSTLPLPNAENTDASAISYIEYKVEKDDTLQKIAKKFYDSYSKWPQIYEANKVVITNPDFLKPGIIIKIPQAVK
jgi:nucleoid-associated protein YgaU